MAVEDRRFVPVPVESHEVRWQKWRFRIGFSYREGLILHAISYLDGGRERPVLHRAALSDMVVPYGDSRPAYFHRNAFRRRRVRRGHQRQLADPRGRLTDLCRDLAHRIVSGGEGATRVFRVRVRRARNVEDADRIGRAIVNSPLVKTAVHGGDPNWAAS